MRSLKGFKIRFYILFTALVLFVGYSTAFAVLPVLSWARFFTSFDAPKVDYGNGIAVSNTGPSALVYVVGNSGEDANGDGIFEIDDYRMLKYDANGNLLSQASYNDPDNGIDVAYAALIDGSRFYVAGTSFNSLSGTRDFRTRKYDLFFTEIASWNNNPDTVFHGAGDDVARGLAADSLSNIYVTGFTNAASNNTPQTTSDYLTVKYDSNGTEQWNVTYNDTSNNLDAAHAIAIDPQGNPVVTGVSFNPASGNLDFRTIRYASSSGAILWSDTFNSPLYGADDEARAVGIDRTSGDIYVGGFSKSGSGFFGKRRWTIVKYNASGAPGWTPIYRTGSVEGEFINGIAVATSGEPYATGGNSEAGVFLRNAVFDIKTVKYASSTGNEVWNRYFDSGMADYGRGVAIDTGGNLYLTGYRQFVAGVQTPQDDIVTVKYGTFPDPGPPCNVPLSFPIQWTDNVITPNVTKVRGVHTSELRGWINNQRQDVLLPLYSFTDSQILGTTLVRKVHVDEMRSAISDVYTACSQPTPTQSGFLDPLIAWFTKIRAFHITDLRSAIQNAP